MSCRFGSPTKRAHSGTEEEFNRAVQKYMQNPHSIRILFYFRNAAVNALDIDLYQLLQVLGHSNQFKMNIPTSNLFAKLKHPT